MLNETFYLDGVDAISVGIKLQKNIEFSAAVPIVETAKIPGRNGVLIFHTGAYENRKGEASCFALDENVSNVISKASAFLLSEHGYRRLECSDDPTHFWRARVKNGARVESRMRTLNPFEIVFDCMPQKWVKTGEQLVEFTENGSLYNDYGGVALPLITVYGTGSGVVEIGSYTVSINSIDGILYLDSETQNAYNDNGNQNLNISAAEFPKLVRGDNNVSFSGDITKVEIVPRWWDK